MLDDFKGIEVGDGYEFGEISMNLWTFWLQTAIKLPFAGDHLLMT